MADLIGPASAPNSTTTRPALYRVFGVIDTWFRDCSTPASQDGTAYQADFFNGLLGQLRTLIRGNGQLAAGTGPVIPEVNTSDAMLLTAVQLLIARGQPNAGADTGQADAMLVGPATPWPEYVKGARLWVVKNPAAGPNVTAAPTIAVSNLAAITVVRRDGSAVAKGDLLTGAAFCVEFDGAYFRLVAPAISEIAAGVQSGKWTYAVDAGAVNAAAVTLFPVPTTAVDGMEILVRWSTPNTSTTPTINVGGIGTKSVLKQGGGAPAANDLVAYRSATNELLALECKSYLDSGGVHAAHFVAGSKYAHRYKLFHDPTLRSTVLDRLLEQFVSAGLCPRDATVRLGLIHAHATPHNAARLAPLFAAEDWLLFGPNWLQEHLERMARGSYENSTAAVVAKLLLRPTTLKARIAGGDLSPAPVAIAVDPVTACH